MDDVREENINLVGDKEVVSVGKIELKTNIYIRSKGTD